MARCRSCRMPNPSSNRLVPIVGLRASAFDPAKRDRPAGAASRTPGNCHNGGENVVSRLIQTRDPTTSALHSHAAEGSRCRSNEVSGRASTTGHDDDQPIQFRRHGPPLFIFVRGCSRRDQSGDLDLTRPETSHQRTCPATLDGGKHPQQQREGRGPRRAIELRRRGGGVAELRPGRAEDFPAPGI